MIKKLIFAALFAIATCIVSIINFDSVQTSAIELTAENALIVDARCLTQEEANEFNALPATKLARNGTTIKKGDYIVSLTVQNNEGFASMGCRIYFDSTVCTPLLNASTGKPLHYDEVLSGVSVNVAYNAATGSIGLGTMSVDSVDGNGNLYSFFLRPKAGHNPLTPTEEQNLIKGVVVQDWMDDDNQQIDYDEPNTFVIYREQHTVTCIVGDINNDGVINVTDVTILLSLVQNYDISMNAYAVVYTTSTTSVEGYYLIAVGDVNGDGVIDSDDVDDLLEYYTYYVVGNHTGYTGLIGTITYADNEIIVTFP